MFSRIFVALAICLLFVERSGAAEFSISAQSKVDYLRIDMTGAIDPGDLFKLMSALNQVRYDKTDKIKKAIVFLDSEGGDVKESLVIGRFLRAQRLRTGIASGARCSSACAYAFLGGTQRYYALAHRQKSSMGGLGVHAFRIESNQASFSDKEMKNQIQLAQKEMFELVKYFREVDADPRLLTLAVETEPPAMHWVTNSEAIEFCIFVWDERAQEKFNPVNPYKIKEATRQPQEPSWQRSNCRNP
jgi:hypothetical protein